MTETATAGRAENRNDSLLDSPLHDGCLEPDRMGAAVSASVEVLDIEGSMLTFVVCILLPSLLELLRSFFWIMKPTQSAIVRRF